MADWQPIDTAPKDGTVVLLYVPEGIDRPGYEAPPWPLYRVTLGWFGRTADRGYANVWCCDQVQVETFHGSDYTGSWNEYEWLRITPKQWMPLPDPPESESEQPR
jgi:hypothetical protein